ncbi:hypothetical protein ACFX1R_031747 [Malus domestica]
MQDIHSVRGGGRFFGGSGGGDPRLRPHQHPNQHALKCPRCDSQHQVLLLQQLQLPPSPSPSPALPLMLLPQQPSLNQPSLPKFLRGKGRDCRDGCCFFLELSLLGLGLGRLSEGKRRYKC